jgi:LysM domain
MRTLFVTLLLAVTVLGQDKPPAPPATPAQGPPPKNLTKMPDGHFSANSDPKNPENFEVRVVVKGDTLWAIAMDVLKDGRLWPQIWEQNEHIVNPHWIYPNDKILIRPVTRISEAKPPEPEAAAPATPPAPAQPQPLKGKLVAAPYPGLPPLTGPRAIVNLNPPRSFPEVKESDLYCSGFIRPEAVPEDVKVVGRYHDNQPVAVSGDYVYIGKGEEGGVRTGTTYQVLRPTRRISSAGRKSGNLGMHYLEIAQVQVVMGQADHSLARVVQGCETVELGDILVPFNKIDFPALPSKRPFSGTMKASGQVPGNIVLTKDAIVNSGSAFSSTTTVQSAGGSLRSLDRGLTGEGGVVYVDVGKGEGVKAGDFFIVFRDVELKDAPLANKGKLGKARTAIAELVIIKVEDRASTALVTYSDDVISLGDVVERR